MLLLVEQQEDNMKTIKQNDLNFHRAGSDFLGYAWSAHVSGPGMVEMSTGVRYLIERPDGTTHEVGVVGRKRMDGVTCMFIVEADGFDMMGL